VSAAPDTAPAQSSVWADLRASWPTLLGLGWVLYEVFRRLDHWAERAFQRPQLASMLVGVIELGLFAVALCLAPAISRVLRWGALPRPASPALLLFDGRCGLCSGLVRFVLSHDRRDAFRFAALESEAAARVLAPHGGLSTLPDSAVVLTDVGTPAERLLLRSDAILFIADQMGQPWRLALLGFLLPKAVRNFLYDRVAASRARLFGRTDTCMVPTPEQRAKFVE